MEPQHPTERGVPALATVEGVTVKGSARFLDYPLDTRTQKGCYISSGRNAGAGSLSTLTRIGGLRDPGEASSIQFPYFMRC